MTYTGKHIVEVYSGIKFGRQAELIENLSRSLKKEKRNKEHKFYKSFGAFASEKSPKEIVKM